MRFRPDQTGLQLRLECQPGSLRAAHPACIPMMTMELVEAVQHVDKHLYVTGRPKRVDSLRCPYFFTRSPMNRSSGAT